MLALYIIYFSGGILFPYALEQYAYQKWTASANKQTVDKTSGTSQTYGWRIVWDAAFFFVLIAAGYRIIFSNVALSRLEWLGYLVFLLGEMVRIGALKALGQFYNEGIAIQTDHQLVRTGVYQVLRHPLHLGTLLKITGLALFSPAWLSVPAVIASVLLALNLNHTEDRIHSAQFAVSFEEYYRSTWDIVDLFIWKNSRR